MTLALTDERLRELAAEPERVILPSNLMQDAAALARAVIEARELVRRLDAAAFDCVPFDELRNIIGGN